MPVPPYKNMNIIVKKNKSRGTISKENRTEWRNERRAKMLYNRGYSVSNVHAMMDSGSGNFPGRKLEKMIKHTVKSEEMNLSGEHL